MRKTKRTFSVKALLALLIIALSLTLTACFGDEVEDEATTEEETTITSTAAPGLLSLRVSQTTVKSDNSDSATITATVLDTANAVIDGAIVTFSSTAGQFNGSSIATTDDNGEAEIVFSAGPTTSNQIVTITATVSGIDPSTVPIQITGTTITLTPGNTSIEVGGDPDTLLIEVNDAGSNPLSDALVTIIVATSSTGTATISPATGTTDINGELWVDVTGTSEGSVTVRVQAAGVTGAQTYSVTAPGGAFGISSPTTDPYSLDTGVDLTITVNAPTQSEVIFATSLGAWDGGTGMVVQKPVAGGTVYATLKSADAGIATVQVLDADDPSITDTLKVVISAPSTEASQIALQASATTVAISSGSVSNSVTLRATVKNLGDEPVGNAPVHFSIENPTGGGESISPVIAYTNGYGEATATFISGSLSSGGEGVPVTATVVGTTINDTINIIIGGTAGSVMIGVGSTIQSVYDDTMYELPMSVIVADSSGNAVQGATVTLSLWPVQYSTGMWVEVSSGKCEPDITDTDVNEDLNRNLIEDPGEDLNGDLQLTPLNSAGGTVPASLTTDNFGMAVFSLIYPKLSAAWIVNEIKASTWVLGTETQSTYTFRLGWLKGEECSLPHSPYGP
jgi:hypothetical protein